MAKVDWVELKARQRGSMEAQRDALMEYVRMATGVPDALFLDRLKYGPHVGRKKRHTPDDFKRCACCKDYFSPDQLGHFRLHAEIVRRGEPEGKGFIVEAKICSSCMERKLYNIPFNQMGAELGSDRCHKFHFPVTEEHFIDDE